MLKYSSFFVTGAVSILAGYILHKLTTRTASVVYYTSHPQWVTLAPLQGQPPIQPIGTFTLFLLNQGRAAAKEVHVGHFWLPANNVYPDIPREIVDTPGGGKAIRFPVIPPKTLISISYLFFGPIPIEQIISYVGWEEGTAKRIPVMLQRIWPGWFNKTLLAFLIAGLWVAVNLLLTLIRFLARSYWK